MSHLQFRSFALRVVVLTLLGGRAPRRPKTPRPLPSKRPARRNRPHSGRWRQASLRSWRRARPTWYWGASACHGPTLPFGSVQSFSDPGRMASRRSWGYASTCRWPVARDGWRRRADPAGGRGPRHRVHLGRGRLGPLPRRHGGGGAQCRADPGRGLGGRYCLPRRGRRHPHPVAEAAGREAGSYPAPRPIPFPPDVSGSEVRNNGQARRCARGLRRATGPWRPHRRQVPRRRDTRALTTADPNSMPRAADGFLTEHGESRAVDAGTISPETARPPTPVPSTKPDTRRGLLRASSRERSAPPGNGASPPGRRGRRPASSHGPGPHARPKNLLALCMVVHNDLEELDNCLALTRRELACVGKE